MIYKQEFRAMGCQMLAAIDYPSPRGRQLLGRVPEWFENWEDSLSRFRPESELNRLNRSPENMIRVSDTLWSVFQASLAAEERSGGLVTPTLLESLITAGYKTTFEELAYNQTASHPQERRHFPLQAVERWPETRSLRLPAGLSLDFGGVAKGWAAHQAMLHLRGYGPTLVDAGGDIAISGLQAEGEPWLVDIEDPRHPEDSLGTLRLGRCGVATSGKDYRRWKQGDVWRHHIIDPRSGEPAETDLLSATVIAPDVMQAEMAAKVILILGSQAGTDWLAAHSAFAGMYVTENGQVVYGHSFEKYLWELN
jgi:FAD:protein FMN transferase